MMLARTFAVMTLAVVLFVPTVSARGPLARFRAKQRAKVTHVVPAPGTPTHAAFHRGAPTLYNTYGVIDPYQFDGLGNDPYRYGSFDMPDLLDDPNFIRQNPYTLRGIDRRGLRRLGR